MKFITVRDFRTYPKKIWDDLPKENEMIITNNGKPIALLTPITDSNIESTLKVMRQVKAKMSIEKMWDISTKNKNSRLSGKQIDKIISETRKNKK